ncbi:MAG: hypothetical protein WDW38_001434 [Sanguina aurantia]
MTALIGMYSAAKAAAKLPSDPDLAFCYSMLTEVSRSFAIVIQQLPNPLRDAIAIFYLVLRGLDTVEDDMAIPVAEKLPQLLSFHKDIYDKSYTSSCGYNHYKRLMSNFGHVIRVFLSLDPSFQKVIADITRRMGEGMAEFIEKEVKTLEDYNKYCHYVAGLVGIGLSELFASSHLESEHFRSDLENANHMGLFLQKTNIIRDYLEDVTEIPAPRMFWPREVWGLYAAQLDEFKEPVNRTAAVQCLNHLIGDALQHLPRCIDYMESIRHPQVFRFCAIPQIMAAATLSMCYNNGAVFEGVVKMRRGKTAVVFHKCNHMGDLLTWFIDFLSVLRAKAADQADPRDPTLPTTAAAIAAHMQLCKEKLRTWEKANPTSKSALSIVRDYGALTLTGTYAYYACGLSGDNELPVFLQPYASALQQHRQLQQVLSVAMLLLVLLFVLSRR